MTKSATALDPSKRSTPQAARLPTNPGTLSRKCVLECGSPLPLWILAGAPPLRPHVNLQIQSARGLAHSKGCRNKSKPPLPRMRFGVRQSPAALDPSRRPTPQAARIPTNPKRERTRALQRLPQESPAKTTSARIREGLNRGHLRAPWWNLFEKCDHSTPAVTA